MQTKVRCRTIREDDLERVADLLVEGFPRRSRSYWTDGFDRLRRWNTVPDMPRFGYLIESGGRPVGVVLLLSHRIAGDDGPRLRSNISSWYVDPDFRMHASMLIFFALKHRAATYINISPAPHTWDTIEAQGFSRYTAGQVITVPALRTGGWRTKVHTIDPARLGALPERFAYLPERDILVDHAAMGCDSLLVEARGELQPFVFLRFRIKSGRFPAPARQLVFCRTIEDYHRFSAPIGRHFAKRLIPFVIHDGDRLDPGYLGYYRNGMGPKYFRGPHHPRSGDLTYTEKVVFGP